MISREQNDALCDFGRRWRLDGDYLRCQGCARAEGKRPNAATCQVGRPMLASCDGQPFKHEDGCKQAKELHPWAELRGLLAEPAPWTDAALIDMLVAERVGLQRFTRPDNRGESFTTSGSTDIAKIVAAMRRAIDAVMAETPGDIAELGPIADPALAQVVGVYNGARGGHFMKLRAVAALLGRPA